MRSLSVTFKPSLFSVPLGLLPDDVILSINEVRIRTKADMDTVVTSLNPGDTVKVQVQRAGSRVTFDVTVGVHEAQPDVGFTVRDGAAEGTVEIAKVTAPDGSEEQDSSLRPGDLLLSIDGQHLSSTQGFYDVLKRLTPGQRIALVIQRGEEIFECEVRRLVGFG